MREKAQGAARAPTAKAPESSLLNMSAHWTTLRGTKEDMNLFIPFHHSCSNSAFETPWHIMLFCVFLFECPFVVDCVWLLLLMVE